MEDISTSTCATKLPDTQLTDGDIDEAYFSDHCLDDCSTEIDEKDVEESNFMKPCCSSSLLIYVS